MKIIAKQIANNQEEAAVSLEKTNTGLRITAANGAFFDFDVSLVQFAPDIMYMVQATDGSIRHYWYSEIVESRDAFSAILARKRINDVHAIAAFVVESIEGEVVCHCAFRDAVYIGNSVIDKEVIVDESVELMSVKIKRHCPGLAQFFKRGEAKQKANGSFVAVDAIVAMEQQVDMLTKVVEILAGKLPAAERPVWLDAMFAAINDHSCVDVFGVERSINNIALEKAKGRSIQSAYFSTINNA